MTAAAAATRLGPVQVRVADLDRAIAVSRDVIGLDVQQRDGSQAAFLGAGGYHHHIGLNTWDSLDGTPPPRGHTGLYHTAFLFADRAALGAAIRRVDAAGIPLTGAADHGVSEAVYLDDPDGNGVELYRDRPAAEWPRDASGNLAINNTPLDIAALRSEAA